MSSGRRRYPLRERSLGAASPAARAARGDARHDARGRVGGRSAPSRRGLRESRVRGPGARYAAPRMGKEVSRTTLTIDGVDHAGDALLETDELLLRVEGEPKRRRLRLSELAKVRASASALSFEHGGHRYAIEVAGAAKWAEKILSPPSLLDKLGIARGAAIHVAAVTDEAFDALLAKAEVTRVRLGPEASVVVRGMTTKKDLATLAEARRAVGDGLVLWAVYPKAQKELGENDVRAAAIAEGLVDVKVARFSERCSALKLVVRKSERGAAPAKKTAKR